MFLILFSVSCGPTKDLEDTTDSGLTDDFAIEELSYPAEIVSGADAEVLEIHWRGSPAWPVTVTGTEADCDGPQDFDCVDEFSEVFEDEANPIEWAILQCVGLAEGEEVNSTHDIVLEDATGDVTEAEQLTLRCTSNP